MNNSTLPDPTTMVRRVVVAVTTDEEPGGERVGVGCEFTESGVVVVDLDDVQAPPTTFDDRAELRRTVRQFCATGPGGDVWVGDLDEGAP